MRVGSNPNNHKTIELNTASHRVIIPIYIPNAEGYFKDSFAVLKVCIASLLATINEDTVVTLISNNSSDEVNRYITELWSQGKIDRAVFNKENVGKMNAILAETRASFEEFITYSDADVFFDKSWLKETFNIYSAFPKAGFVSMNPMPGSYGYASSAIVDTVFSVKKNTVKISELTPYQDLAHFHESVGRETDITEKLFSGTALALIKNNTQCYIGAGHFCCTVKKNILLHHVPLHRAFTSGAEYDFLDVPFEKSGYWRLSSVKSYVWHMGNVLEQDWANAKKSEIENFKEAEFSFNTCITNAPSLFSKAIPYSLKIRIPGFLKKMNLLK